MKKNLVIWTVVLMLLISILACGSETANNPPNSEPGEQVEQADEVAVVDEEGTSEDDDVTIEADPPQDEPVQIYILSITDPDTPSIFYTAVDGSHLVSVELVVENLGQEPVDVNPLNFSLVDELGLVYSSELGASDNHDQIATLNLYQGERVHGWVSFSVEDGMIPAKIKFELDFWSDDVLEADLTTLSSDLEWAIAEIQLENPNLGDTSSGSDLSLSALAVVDPSPASDFHSVAEGFHLVSVEILVRNESSVDVHGVNALNSYLIDTLGFVYEVELGASDLGQIDTVDIAQGEAVKGYVTFEIPDGRIPLGVHYLVDFWGDDPPLTVGLAE